jgi:hypothetical protein
LICELSAIYHLSVLLEAPSYFEVERQPACPTVAWPPAGCMRKTISLSPFPREAARLLRCPHDRRVPRSDSSVRRGVGDDALASPANTVPLSQRTTILMSPFTGPANVFVPSAFIASTTSKPSRTLQKGGSGSRLRGLRPRPCLHARHRAGVQTHNS